MMNTEYVIDELIIDALDIPLDGLSIGKAKYGVPACIMKKYLNNEVAVKGGVGTEYPFERINGVLDHNIQKIPSVKSTIKHKDHNVISVGNNDIRNITINDGEVLFDIQDMYKTTDYRIKHSSIIANIFKRIAMFDFMHGKGCLTYSYVRLPSILYDNAYKMLDNPYIRRRFMLSFRGSIQMYVRQDNGLIFITQKAHKYDKPLYDDDDIYEAFFEKGIDPIYQPVIFEKVWEKDINVSAESNDLELMLKELMNNVIAQIVHIGDNLSKSQLPLVDILEAVKMMDFNIRTFIRAYDADGVVYDPLLLLISSKHNELMSLIRDSALASSISLPSVKASNNRVMMSSKRDCWASMRCYRDIN